MCGSGNRSQRAAELLTEKGFKCSNISDGFRGDGGEKIGWKNTIFLHSELGGSGRGRRAADRAFLGGRGDPRTRRSADDLKPARVLEC